MCKKSKCKKCKSRAPKPAYVASPSVVYVNSTVNGSHVSTAGEVFSSGILSGCVTPTNTFGFVSVVGGGFF